MDEIEGWFHPAAAVIIDSCNAWQKSNAWVGSIVEIGLWHGKSFKFLNGLAGRGERAIGIDIELKEQLRANLASFPRDQYVLLQRDSSTISPQEMQAIAGAPIRMFHVDGHHSFAGASNDLALAFASTDRRGVIFLDDFFSPTLPAVTEAAFILHRDGRTNGFVPFALGGAKCFFAHSDFAESYKDACRRSAQPQVECTDLQDFLGGRALVYHFHF